MKKRKDHFVQKIMALLLSAVLAAGMVSNALSTSVLAQENTHTHTSLQEVTQQDGNRASYTRRTMDEGVLQSGKRGIDTANLVSGTDWVIDKDGRLTISSDAGMADWKENGSSANDTKVKSVEIQNSVTNIAARAFLYNDIITDITIPDSVTSIGRNAFNGCSGLTGIILPKNLTSIESAVFAGCEKLTDITIPEGVTNIKLNAFNGCSSLTSITIPGSVEVIEATVFDDCTSLVEVTMLGETPPTVRSNVFRNCGFVTDNIKGIHVPQGKAVDYKREWKDWENYIADDDVPVVKHEHGGDTYTAWAEADSLPMTEGNYYLTKDVTLSDTWNASNIKLCLNGKNIRVQGKHSVISIAASCSLLLFDCAGTGIITGGQESGISNSGNLNMYGGTISGNSGAMGGGVFNNGFFNMYGGSIIENNGDNCGGVYTSGRFNMFGGRISSNTSQDGAGGVGIGSSGNLKVGGDAVIRENTCNGKENNVCLGTGQMIEIDFITSMLSDSAHIGITSISTPTEESPVKLTQANPDDFSGCFYSDNPAYAISQDDGRALWLTAVPHTHRFGTEWKSNETEHWHECDCGAESDREAHVYDNNSDMICNSCSYDRTLSDTQPPVGKIILEKHFWTGFSETITFGQFFNEVKQVSIEASDTSSGVDKVYYYLSPGALTETQVETLADSSWTEGDSFSIIPDRSCVIYAKITDKAENTTYLSSDGLVFDSTAPVIIGVTDGETYNTSQLVTVQDANLDSVTVNGTEVTLQGGAFMLEMKSAEQTIVATDKAGNTATVTVTVKEDSHSHNLKRVSAKAATCTEAGNQAYYTCSGCSKWFSDAEGMQEIADKDSVVIAAAGHRYTSTTPQTCTVCGYVIAPPTGTKPGNGNVTPDVKQGKNAPATSISTPVKELEDMLLTEDEKQQMQKGINIRIILDVQDAGNTVSDSDKAVIKQALNGFTVGQYLNIDLYKLVGEHRTDITETAKKIEIVISVPDSLKNTDSNRTRTFAVIRVHDGKAELLTDLDNIADTITIETDRFSTYAIVYKDTQKAGSENGGSENGGNGGNGGSENGGNGGSENGGNHNGSDKKDTKRASSKSSEPKTGDDTPLELYATLSMIAGFAYLLLYFADRKRGMTEETKKQLVSRLVGWAKRGGRLRNYLALAAIFTLLLYYHSIGRKACGEWEEVYGK